MSEQSGFKAAFANGQVFQRLSSLPWAQQLRKIRSSSLFSAAAIGTVGLALASEIVVYGGAAVARKEDHARYEMNAIPREKPEFIKEWERRYG